VIESAIFSDNDDNVLDGRGGLGLLGGFLSGGCDRRSQVGEERKQAGANHEVLSDFFQNIGRRHDFPPEMCPEMCRAVKTLGRTTDAKLNPAQLQAGDTGMNSR
jgi:hypothetical protein